MRGELWLVHDELPKPPRLSPQLLIPSCKYEEQLPQGKLARGEICSTFIDAFPVTSSGVSVLG